MNCITFVITSVAICGLASCSTPAEQCEVSVAAEQRNVSRLLQEVEANIARGYTFQDTTTSETDFRFCAGGFRGGHGRLGLGYSSCYGGPQTTRERVPIDPSAEMRKRDALQNRLGALSSKGTLQCVSGLDGEP
ncbi:hypothetical protein [Paracoccus sp. (in: a-proteobacteria)]|uniref:hypothetical protein n=1 Tax=Paracoccus sp. TaxID=267 RepID=UPI00396CD495